MEASIRKPLQGLRNIVRFNWHYYLLSITAVVVLLIVPHYLDHSKVVCYTLASLIVIPTMVSLGVSTYVYDFSDLYSFRWLNNKQEDQELTILNLHAGFDESSGLIKKTFNKSTLLVGDFYEPSKHTEISINRARNAYPAYPGTISVNAVDLPFKDRSADKIFAFLSAHEIRKEEERITFLKELNRIIKDKGQVLITEHLRDMANFLAYNIGFFHFHSRGIWLRAFKSAGLKLVNEKKITPFISTFILEKNGTTS